MGLIATTTTLKTRYPGMPQSNSAYDTVLALNIDRAEGIVNSFLSRRYSIPFTVIPPIVLSLVEDLSTAFAYRSNFMRDSHNTSEWADELKKCAMETLDLIREREIDIVDTSGNLIGENSTRKRVQSNTKEYTPAFGIDTNTAWDFDKDRVTDQADARL